MNQNTFRRQEKNKLALVISGHGFIGMNLVKLLQRADFRVKVLSRYSVIGAGVSVNDEDFWATEDLPNRADVEVAC